MYKNDGVTRRYSEGFKLKILSELSTGKYSKRQLARIYGITFFRYIPDEITTLSPAKRV